MISVLIQTKKYKDNSKRKVLRGITDALYDLASQSYQLRDAPSEICIEFREKWSFLTFISSLTEKDIPFSVYHRQKTFYLV